MTSQPQLQLELDPLLGAQVDGRYVIERVHGRGGMAVVYAGMHRELRRAVAIKVLEGSWAQDPEAVELFLLEARTASSLSHPHIVPVSDLGSLPDGRPYLVMPMIAGHDLATLLLREGPQPARRVARLLKGVASALDLIHAKGFLHRDIKSENLMHVVSEDGAESVLVLDFGIASAALPHARNEQGGWCGTPEFMPPEALAGEPADERGDVYGLATVAFELLTGCLPFDCENLTELIARKTTEAPRTLSQVMGAPVCDELELVLERGLAQTPDGRFTSAGELIREFAAAAELTPLEKPRRTTVPPRFRGRTLAGTGGAILLGRQIANTPTPTGVRARPQQASQASEESGARPTPQPMPSMTELARELAPASAYGTATNEESGARPTPQPMPKVELPVTALASGLEAVARDDKRPELRGGLDGASDAAKDAIANAITQRQPLAPIDPAAAVLAPPVARPAPYDPFKPSARLRALSQRKRPSVIRAGTPAASAPAASAPAVSAPAASVSAVSAPPIAASVGLPPAPQPLGFSGVLAPVAERPDPAPLPRAPRTLLEVKVPNELLRAPHVPLVWSEFDDSTRPPPARSIGPDEYDPLLDDLRGGASRLPRWAVYATFPALLVVALVVWSSVQPAVPARSPSHVTAATAPVTTPVSAPVESAPPIVSPTVVVPAAETARAVETEKPMTASAAEPAPANLPENDIAPPRSAGTPPLHIAPPRSAGTLLPPRIAPPRSAGTLPIDDAPKHAEPAQAKRVSPRVAIAPTSPTPRPRADPAVLQMRPLRAAAAPAPVASAPLEAPPVVAEKPRADRLVHEATDAMLRGDTITAGNRYEQAIKADPSFAPAWRGKGLLLERSGHPREAAGAFREFLRLAPNGAAADAIRKRLDALEPPQ